MSKPLAVDLCCGLGGWAEGLLAEGYDVIGFDIERHVYGEHRYPGLLVIQDVLTLHGSQFRRANLIVASPPCQQFSYMAMPWTKAKAKAAAIRADKTGAELERLTRLFNACFRIQREASEAAGHHIPLIVENVKGAQPWVGRARWSFGSFYLWGDVPALMPIAKHVKVGGLDWKPPGDPRHRKGQAFNPAAQGKQVREATKNSGGSWFKVSHNNVPHSRGDAIGHTPHMTNPAEHGVKQRGSGAARFDEHLNERRREATGLKGHGGTWFEGNLNNAMRVGHSSSTSRKFASALIAKIPLPLSRHIAATFRMSANSPAKHEEGTR